MVLHKDCTFCRTVLRCRYARTELITLDLICPSTYQLLRNSGGDSGLDLSFDKSTSLKRLFSSASVSLAEASKPDLSFGCFGGDYTPSCHPSLVYANLAYDLNDLIIKYKIPRDLHPRLPSEDFVMSELSVDAIGIYHRMIGYALDKIFEYVVEPLSVILQLEPKILVRPANIPIARDAHVSPSIVKESTVTPASKSLKLSANVDLTAFVVAIEHDEEMVSAEVHDSDLKMIDDTITVKSGHAFMQGMFAILNNDVELAGVVSGRFSSGPNDVVVALSIGEKGDGLTPSSIASEEAVVNPSRA
nr:hypothetical protein [Tanacetum cinerariifolium]